MTVTLMLLPDDPLNMPAWKAVKAIPGMKVDVVYCPGGMEDYWSLNVLHTEGGACHFGTKGIDWFVKRMYQEQNDTVQAKVDANLRKVFG